MEDALAVEVAEPPGNVQGQLEADGPGEWGGAVEQLLQVPPIDVLRREKEGQVAGGLGPPEQPGPWLILDAQPLTPHLCQRMQLALVNADPHEPAEEERSHQQ